MQSFKPTYNAHSNGGQTADIHFAPIQTVKLTRTYVIYANEIERRKTEAVLSDLPGYCLIGWQKNQHTALQDILHLRPELIVIYSHCASSLEALLIRAIKTEVSAANLIVITNELDQAILKELFQSGATGYCLNSNVARTLSLAMQTVAEGAIWLEQSFVPHLLDNNGLSEEDSKKRQTANQVLSDKELKVLRLIAEGLTNPEIAKSLWLSPETIKSHVKNIMRKLCVSDRTQAAVAAVRLGLDK